MWGVDRALLNAWSVFEQEFISDEDTIDEISKELCLHNGFARLTMEACL